MFSLTTGEVEARDPKAFISRITTDTGFVSDFLIDLLVMEIPRLYFLISTLVRVSRMGNGTLVLSFILIIPVIVLGILMLCFNLFADGLRDAFDPKMLNK